MSLPEMNALEILVIDGEPFIGKLIGHMLYEMNAKQIVEAEDGAVGLTKAMQSRCAGADPDWSFR